jgi:hypothetical protein
MVSSDFLSVAKKCVKIFVPKSNNLQDVVIGSWRLPLHCLMIFIELCWFVNNNNSQQACFNITDTGCFPSSLIAR